MEIIINFLIYKPSKKNYLNKTKKLLNLFLSFAFIYND